MIVADIMTQPVISLHPSARVGEAIQVMLDHRISGVPVVNESGQLVGIVSEGDLLRRVETGTEKRRPRWLEFLSSPGRLATEYVHTHGRLVDEIMTRDVVSTAESSPIDEVVDLMERRRIKRVPVVREGKVVGIVTRANLMQAVATLVEPPASEPATDRALRRRILDAIHRQPWAPGYQINVIVRNGRVDLWGALTDERERKALRVLVENIPGVDTIRDHMIWVEPMTGAVLDDPDARQDDFPT